MLVREKMTKNAWSKLVILLFSVNEKILDDDKDELPKNGKIDTDSISVYSGLPAFTFYI
ncbi:hypothetical protein FHS19_002445 [Paenibacillus rhizosphaerae]|uniref:Uncharacterized protein n=1 Tax=Paenibacillus rhizosphaerae TaxID=297318 RepID=A0A839TME9_9BACL|nr:hypothetical protein [Paenibacillus rhizosphaerae]MBB3127791.1 hypothetical protein [Paenibacillus rhizosphaerae]